MRLSTETAPEGRAAGTIWADLTIPALAATSKRQAFRMIAEETAALFSGDEEALLNALLDRERIGTTGIGNGVAIPHVKIEGIDRTYSVFVRLEEPVDYDAIDEEPVDLIFLLLAPADSKTTQHLKVLAQMSRFLKDAEVAAALRGSRLAVEIEKHMARWIADQEDAARETSASQGDSYAAVGHGG